MQVHVMGMLMGSCDGKMWVNMSGVVKLMELMDNNNIGSIWNKEASSESLRSV